MSLRLLLLAAVLASVTACERGPSAADLETERRRADERAADEERIAELRELEDRAAARDAEMQAAQTDAERRQIAAERAKIERERQRLAAVQKEVDEKRRAQEREEDRRAAEDQAAADKAAQRQAHAERTLDFFYEALDPHGEWMEVGSYGYCWRPNAASRPNWRPYLDGNWAWTDYGWTWASKEPFGWATYHYGRWTRVRRLGWVWVPGSEWAPAWVAWRRSDRYIGWAPLPPEAHSGSGFTAAVDSYYDIGPENYCFVETEDFGEPTYVDQVVESQQNVTVINTTVNVTNVTYKKVENKTVVFNGGPNISELRPRTEIRRLKVERIDDQKTAGPAEQRGNVLRMNAPVVASSSKPTKQPTRIKERVKAEEVERGWSGGGDRSGIDKLRAQQKEEARKAERAQQSAPPAQQETTAPAPRQEDSGRSGTARRAQLPPGVEIGGKIGTNQNIDKAPAAAAPLATPAAPVEPAAAPGQGVRPRRERKEAAERPAANSAPGTPQPQQPAVPAEAALGKVRANREPATPNVAEPLKRTSRPAEPIVPPPAAAQKEPQPPAPVPAAPTPVEQTAAPTPGRPRRSENQQPTAPEVTKEAMRPPAPAAEAAPAPEPGRRPRSQQQPEAQAPATPASTRSGEVAPATEAAVSPTNEAADAGESPGVRRRVRVLGSNAAAAEGENADADSDRARRRIRVRE
jgi:hypothetical protein